MEMEGMKEIQYTRSERRPAVSVPKGACDVHHHIYNPQEFPYRLPQAQGPADYDVYRRFREFLNLERDVIVQPSAYGTDNRCLADALRRSGGAARGVAVIDRDTGDAELEEMNAAGVRGIRFNIEANGNRFDVDEIQDLAAKAANLGWHVDIWAAPDTLAELGGLLKNLPCPVVFDHFGHLPASAVPSHPAFQLISGLLSQGKAWVKVSGMYIDSAYPNDYRDAPARIREYLSINEDRVLWGTDWPHPGMDKKPEGLPDDARMLEILHETVGDEALFRKVLVENPGSLYGF